MADSAPTELGTVPSSSMPRRSSCARPRRSASGSAGCARSSSGSWWPTVPPTCARSAARGESGMLPRLAGLDRQAPDHLRHGVHPAPGRPEPVRVPPPRPAYPLRGRRARHVPARAAGPRRARARSGLAADRRPPARHGVSGRAAGGRPRLRRPGWARHRGRPGPDGPAPGQDRTHGAVRGRRRGHRAGRGPAAVRRAVRAAQRRGPEPARPRVRFPYPGRPGVLAARPAHVAECEATRLLTPRPGRERSCTAGPRPNCTSGWPRPD